MTLVPIFVLLLMLASMKGYFAYGTRVHLNDDSKRNSSFIILTLMKIVKYKLEEIKTNIVRKTKENCTPNIFRCIRKYEGLSFSPQNFKLR